MKIEDLSSNGYEIIKAESNRFIVKSTNYAYLLIEIIQNPTYIKNALGKEINQFLFPGATIKKEIKTGRIYGIEKMHF